jgi:superfamily I DNA/RNA helicase
MFLFVNPSVLTVLSVWNARAQVEEQILQTAHRKLDAEAKIIQGGMFTHKYEEEQHHAGLNELIRGQDDAEDKEEAAEGEGVDIICQTIARNEDELALYTQMEAERLQALGSVCFLFSLHHQSHIVQNSHQMPCCASFFFPDPSVADG